MRLWLAGLLFGLECLSGWAGFAQTAGSAGAPPKVVLWVHQQMLAGKAGERDKLEAEICRKFEEFGIPIRGSRWRRDRLAGGFIPRSGEFV